MLTADRSSLAVLQTPLGTLQLRATESALIEALFLENALVTAEAPGMNAVLERAVEQFMAYFSGQLTVFDLPLAPVGTSFQQRVWQQLQQLPFGRTQSYTALTALLGDAKAIRAVAAANGRNPLAVVVPCHRVIGANGALTGYAGGLWRKEWLLRHEGALPQLSLL